MIAFIKLLRINVCSSFEYGDGKRCFVSVFGSNAYFAQFDNIVFLKRITDACLISNGAFSSMVKRNKTERNPG